jgi:transposase-like protein
MQEPKTLREAIVLFSDPDNCLNYMVARRWPNGVVCPTCGRTDVRFLKNQRKWQCKSVHPKRQFTLKTGTVMEESPISLEKWLPAMWLLSNCKNGISSYELAKDLGVTQKSAWFMLHRIRVAMQTGTFLKLGGPAPVEVDETFIGGKLKNMHKGRKERVKASANPDNEVAVMGLLDRESRQVRAQVIPNVKRETLQNEILRQIEKGSKVYTDGWKGYNQLEANEYIHETVTHLDEYVRGQVHTQGIENFWSLLKRGLNGTYVAVEPYHLSKYVD